jgi:hypothetical protein
MSASDQIAFLAAADMQHLILDIIRQANNTLRLILETSYGGTEAKNSNKRQGSKRHTRFQHFITFAIRNQFLIFKHWNNS